MEALSAWRSFGVSTRDSARNHLAETIVMVEAVAWSVKHSNQLQAEALMSRSLVSLVSFCVYPPLPTPVRNALRGREDVRTSPRYRGR